MNRKLAHILSLVLILVLALPTLPAGAADEQTYTPILEETFFAGKGGSGILQTAVGGNPYYVAYGDQMMYTSLDGAKWDKRYINQNTSMPLLRSFAYGNGIGIGVEAAGSEKAYLIGKNMNMSPADLVGGTTVNGTAMKRGEVYNKAVKPGSKENGVWLVLQPQIYFDSVSELFFCYGVEYKPGDVSYVELGLYYTDGEYEKTQYNETTEVDALIWTEVQGDFTSTCTVDPSATNKIGKGYDYEFVVTGDGKGHILAICSQGRGNTARTTNGAFKLGETTADGRRFISLINAENKTNVRSVWNNVGSVLEAGILTSAGDLVLWENKQERLRLKKLSEIDWEKAEFGAACKSITTAKPNEIALQIMEHNGKIYTLTKDGKVYRGAVTGNTVALEKENDGVYINMLPADVDLTGKTARAIAFDSGEKLLMLLNGSGNTAEVYSVDFETKRAVKLNADTTYNVITGGGFAEAATVHGYGADTMLVARREKTGSQSSASAPVSDLEFTIVSNNENGYFKPGRYLRTAANTPVDEYTVTIRAAIKNQPSIFEEKQMKITVKPYFTAAISGGAPAAEQCLFELTGGQDTITIALAEANQFFESGSKPAETPFKDFCVAAAVYDAETKMLKSVSTYPGQNGESDIVITLQGNAGDEARVFLWSNFEELKPIVKSN